MSEDMRTWGVTNLNNLAVIARDDRSLARVRTVADESPAAFLAHPELMGAAAALGGHVPAVHLELPGTDKVRLPLHTLPVLGDEVHVESLCRGVAFLVASVRAGVGSVVRAVETLTAVRIDKDLALTT